MNLKERRREIERLRIRLETMLFQKSGGVIKELKDEVVPRRQGIKGNPFAFSLTENNYKIQDVLSVESLVDDTTAR